MTIHPASLGRYGTVTPRPAGARTVKFGVMGRVSTQSCVCLLAPERKSLIVPRTRMIGVDMVS